MDRTGELMVSCQNEPPWYHTFKKTQVSCLRGLYYGGMLHRKILDVWEVWLKMSVKGKKNLSEALVKGEFSSR